MSLRKPKTDAGRVFHSFRVRICRIGSPRCWLANMVQSARDSFVM
jgi:hypothetical protein